MRTLSTDQTAQLIRIVTGEAASADVVAALHRRTGGDTRLVLADLLAALSNPGHARPDPGSEAPLPASVGVLRHQGDYWTATYAGRTAHVRDVRGFHYVAELLRAPGVARHARELVRGHGPRYASAERARQRVTKALNLLLHRLDACHPALAAHLRSSVRRGYLCRYTPDPARAVSWQIVTRASDPGHGDTAGSRGMPDPLER